MNSAEAKTGKQKMRSFTFIIIGGLMILVSNIGCKDTTPIWIQEDGFRYRDLEVKRTSTTGFVEIAASRSGIDHKNHVSLQAIIDNRHMMHGSGVAIGDVTGDDMPEIYVARLAAPDVLYRNLGQWRFEDISIWSGLDTTTQATSGVVMADLDGDHDLDLLLTMPFGPGRVYQNFGQGQFRIIPHAAGLQSSYASTTATLADIDQDGDLDAYIARYKRISLADSLPPEAITWEAVLQDDQLEPRDEFRNHYKFTTVGSRVIRSELAEPDGLYINDGSGLFSQVPWKEAFLDIDGTPIGQIPRDWALTAKFYDVTGDGRIDLYVCNDFDSLDELWIGLGDGRFQRAPNESLRKISNATMSVDFSDVNQDGITDFFTTDMLSRDYSMRLRQRNTRIPIEAPMGNEFFRPQEMQNTLMIGRGDTTFAELGWFAEIAASDWSWATGFLDVDLDGWEDMLITTGHVFDVQDLDAQLMEQRRMAGAPSWKAARSLLRDFPPLALPNVAFRNRKDLTFEDMPNGWGFGSSADVAHGMAFGDLDQDGDLDVVTNRLNAPPGVYNNAGNADRLAVQLEGESPNTSGVGSMIQVKCSGIPAQTRQISAGGSYLSSNQLIAVFAIKTPPCQIVVTWPKGHRSLVQVDKANRMYIIQEKGVDDTVNSSRPSAFPPMYELHQELPAVIEEDFNDFAIQPLLPWRLSRRGPALAAVDINRDGQHELLQGVGRSQRLRLDGLPILNPLLGDATAILGLPMENDLTRIFVGESNYEQFSDTAWIHIYDINSERQVLQHQKLSFGISTPGPMSLADIDLDGDLDLFVGGHFIPSTYPMASDSRIFLYDQGSYQYNEKLSEPLQQLGLISGSVFGDIDADGYMDLILATEWGPIQVFKGSPEGFKDQTSSLGFASYTGWWQGVSLGDFDGDGSLDIVSTNVGWNHRYRSDTKVRLYYGDLNANGQTDLIESFLDRSRKVYRPSRMLNELVQILPWSDIRVTSHQEYSTASVTDLILSRENAISFVETNTYASSIFLNRGDHFEWKPLHQNAQFSVAMSPAVMDANLDGYEDLILSQNWFAYPLSTPRQDAGRGLLLLGQGDGSFVPMHQSGFKVYREGRAISIADFDGDGQEEIAFAQQSGSTLIYKKISKQKGIFIQFDPPDQAIGAVLRGVDSKGHYGPARIVTVGSGYWSQNAISTTIGMRSDSLSAVEVTWPGKKPELVQVDQKTTRLVLRR